MLEVQLAILGLLVLKSLIALIELICIQIVCLFRSYYIYSYSASYNASQNLNFAINYEKNYSHINDYNQIMFYV